MATRRSPILAALATALLPSLAGAQAITDPNQIVGEVRLLVTNPAILDVLGPAPGLGQGLTSMGVSAASLEGTPLTHTTNGQPLPSGLGVSFDLTVESSLTGVPYEIDSSALLDSSRDHYVLLSATSAPVFPDPAPDVTAVIEECLGMLDIRYELDDGSPLPWSHGEVHSDVEGVSGSVAQAWNWQLRDGDSTEYLAVRGGASHHVRIYARIVVGTGDSSFVVPLNCERTVDVDCDEMQLVLCVFTPADCQGPGGPFGQIKGVIDVVGETERVGTIPNTTAIGCGDGPLGNGRSRWLDQPPANGPYVLPNLIPGPPDYVCGAELDIDNGTHEEYFTPPVLGRGQNPRVPVGVGAIVDLDDTFVFEPGHVRGDVLLSGPRRNNSTSMLLDVVHDRRFQYKTTIDAIGQDTPAPGEALTAADGRASVAITGGVDVTGRNYRGTYDLRLAGLDGSTTIWNAPTMHVGLRDTAPTAPEDWHDEWLTITDDTIGDLMVAPGSSQVVDRRYCVSEVHVGYESTTGEFVRPYLLGSGTFSGIDFLGEDASLSFANTAHGTPLGPPSNEGLVSMIVPQGEWHVAPYVHALSPRGVTSITQVPDFSFPVGCRQVIKLRSQLVPLLGSLDECATQAVDLVEGAFRSQDDVVRVQYSLNGGPMQDLCTDCGNSPSFSFPVEWEACENELLVEAEDVEGRVASVTGFVRLDAAPPVIESDRLVLWPPNHAMWCFEDLSRFVRVTDNCPEPIEWAITSCRSSQPDDVRGDDDGPGGGDGHTTNDCRLSEDGRGVCLRAERLGNCPEGRSYGVTIRAVDGCGNVSESDVELESPSSWTPGLSRHVIRPDHVVHGEVMPFPVVIDPDPDAHLPQASPCGR